MDTEARDVDQPSEDGARRLRIQSEKAKEIYSAKVQTYKNTLKQIQELLDIYVANSATTPNEMKRLNEIDNLIRVQYKRYKDLHEELCNFLFREHTSDSMDELQFQQNVFETITVNVNRVLTKVKDTIHLLEADAQSRGSNGTHRTASSVRSLKRQRQPE